jgi:hypothetical protein
VDYYDKLTEVEKVVNDYPFYSGGAIGNDDQYINALSLVRLHQMWNFNVSKKYDTLKLIQILIDEITEMKHSNDYSRLIEFSPLNKWSFRLLLNVENSLPLYSDNNKLLNVLSTYRMEELAEAYGIRFIFDTAKRKGIPLPEGKWSVRKDAIRRKGFIKKLNFRWFSVGEETTEVFILYSGERIDEIDSLTMFYLCKEFRNNFLETIKKGLLSWKNLETILETI